MATNGSMVPNVHTMNDEQLPDDGQLVLSEYTANDVRDLGERQPDDGQPLDDCHNGSEVHV